VKIKRGYVFLPSLKMDLCWAISMESSRRKDSNYVAEHGSILKNNIRTSPFYFLQNKRATPIRKVLAQTFQISCLSMGLSWKIIYVLPRFIFKSKTRENSIKQVFRFLLCIRSTKLSDRSFRLTGVTLCALCFAPSAAPLISTTRAGGHMENSSSRIHSVLRSAVAAPTRTGPARPVSWLSRPEVGERRKPGPARLGPARMSCVLVVRLVGWLAAHESS